MFKLELANGNSLDNVIIDGDTFFTNQNISHEFFAGGLNSIKITHTSNDPDDENSMLEPGTYSGLKLNELCDCNFKKGYKMFSFSDMTAQDLKDLQTDARISYLEMMNEF